MGVRGARRGPTVLTLGPGWIGQKVTGLLHPPGLVEAVAATEAIVQRQAVAERPDRASDEPLRDAYSATADRCTPVSLAAAFVMLRAIPPKTME